MLSRRQRWSAEGDALTSSLNLKDHAVACGACDRKAVAVMAYVANTIGAFSCVHALAYIAETVW